ncbi:MAG TPA: hypothetical protein VEA69_24755 [Tepidisphaeraceae bacterium]|nr:hypothetical protein [Tepidisphaeraceae bacterium]
MPRPAIHLSPVARRVLMQGLLVLVFAGALGLAWVVARHVNGAHRVDLGDVQAHGRLTVRLPARWAVGPDKPVAADPSAPAAKVDAVEVEEPVDPGGGAPVGGRRLRVLRQRAGDLVSPVEHLLRSGRLRPDVVRAIGEGRDGYARESLPVAGWPGQLVAFTTTPRPGAVHKDVIACAVLRGGHAVVVHLEGVGAIVESDRAIVRQVAAAAAVDGIKPPPESGGQIDLPDEIKAEVPAGYFLVPAGGDPNRLGRQLVFDGQSGPGWAAVELAACVWLPDDPADDDVLPAMLAARDPEWRSGPVRRMGPRTLVVDRVALPHPAAPPTEPPPAALGFPARAYLVGNDDGRALLVVMRGGGPRDARLFDPAWAGLRPSVRFLGTKDFAPLLANGAAAVRQLEARGLGEVVQEGGVAAWGVWDASENAAEEEWTESKWSLKREAPPAGVTVANQPLAAPVRTPEAHRKVGLPGAALDGGAAGVIPTSGEEFDPRRGTVAGVRRAHTVGPYAPASAAATLEQTWSAAMDLSRYDAETYRDSPREPRGPAGVAAPARKSWEQRVVVDKGRLTLSSPAGTVPGPGGVPVPPQFVPGAVLPLVIRELAERPCLVKTESFVGPQPVAGPGLLTVFVTRLTDAPLRRDERGVTMDCVTVSVNGTGVVSRWYYGLDDEGRIALRFIDFAGDLKGVTRAPR